MSRQIAQDLTMLTGFWLLAAGFLALFWARLHRSESKSLSIAFMIVGLLVLAWGAFYLAPSAPTIIATGVGAYGN